MSDKKESFYVEITTGAKLKLQLDNDIYGDNAVMTATGINKTVANNDKVVPVSKRYAIASKLCSEVKLRMKKGTGETAKYRSIKILCEVSKLDTVAAALVAANASFNLGNGTGVAWTVDA
jgi:hypothetical protein